MTSLALLICAATVAGATPDDAQSPVEPSDAPASADTTEGDLRYEVLLRDEYLAGQPILVPIRTWNAGTQRQEAPDLERRPWLISFTFDQGKGELERRRTTPPASDPGHLVQLDPRGQRRTVLEIPASSTMRPGEYGLQVQLDPDTLTRVLATRTIQLAPPEPVSADMVRSISASSRSKDLRVWLHRASQGFDLYLSPLHDTTRRVAARWLAHLDGAIDPVLSEASGGEDGARHIVWPDGKRGFGWLALEGIGQTSTPQRVETPWPELELMGRPATDSAGSLHVPVWIPAPKGSGGEVRVISVLGRGAISYRRAATFQARPVSINTTVDDAGAVQLLIATQTAVDLYTVRHVGRAQADLPIPGRRIARAPEGSNYVDVRFGLRETAGEQKGGLSVVVTSQSNDQLQSTWLGLRGTEVARGAKTSIPTGSELKGILPGSDHCGYLFKTGPRAALYREGAQERSFEDSLHGDWGLIRNTAGEATLVRTAKTTIFKTLPLTPPQ